MLYTLFDSNSVAWRSRFNHKLEDKHDMIVVKGFLYNVLTQTIRLQTPNVIFSFDTGNGISERKKLFPGYKERHDEKSPEDLRLDDVARFQIDIIKDKVLPDMGFKNIFYQDGLEGDDIVAAIVKHYVDDKFVVMSSDKDLYQLIGFNCVQTFIDTDRLYNYDAFMQDWNIEPDRWGEVKTLAGCETDKVPSIPGVKEITAIKFLKNQLSATSVKYKEIISEKGKAIRERNRPLVVLPFAGAKTPVIEKDELDINQFKETFKKYGLYDFLKSAMIEKFAKAFKLQTERDIF